MKYFLTFIFCLVISTSASFAQISDKAGDKALKNYLIGLNHTNLGVVESAIENVMILNLNYPDGDYTKIIKKLDEMTLSNKQNNIRVKAFVAASYIKYPVEYNGIKQSHQKEDVKELLHAIDSKMQVSLHK